MENIYHRVSIRKYQKKQVENAENIDAQSADIAE